MKQQISPVAAGVVIAVILAVVAFFVFRGTGPAAQSDVPRDMKKMMNPQNAGPPQNIPGGPRGAQGGPPSSGSSPFAPGGGR